MKKQPFNEKVFMKTAAEARETFKQEPMNTDIREDWEKELQAEIAKHIFIEDPRGHYMSRADEENIFIDLRDFIRQERERVRKEERKNMKTVFKTILIKDAFNIDNEARVNLIDILTEMENF